MEWKINAYEHKEPRGCNSVEFTLTADNITQAYALARKEASAIMNVKDEKLCIEVKPKESI